MLSGPVIAFTSQQIAIAQQIFSVFLNLLAILGIRVICNQNIAIISNYYAVFEYVWCQRGTTLLANLYLKKIYTIWSRLAQHWGMQKTASTDFYTFS